MIEFTLNVFVPNKVDGDRMFSKKLSWPVLPREEEVMLLTGSVSDTVIVIENTVHNLAPELTDTEAAPVLIVYGRLSRKREEDVQLLVQRGFVLSR